MKTKKESIVLSIILLCLILIAVGMSYAFLKTSFFANKTSVLKVGSLSLIFDETSGDAITVEDGTPMYDSEGMKQDNYFTFSLKNNGTLDSSYTIYLENQPLDEGDTRVNSNYVRYNLEKDNSVLQPDSLDGDQAIDKGIIKKNQIINYKMRLWFANDIPQSEENKVFKAKLNVVANQNTKLMAQELGLTNDEKNTITKIVFQDSIKSIENESKVWDTSAAKNKTVMARLVPNTDDTATNTLYIQSNGEVFANYNCNRLFANFSLLKSIENMELLNTSSVTNMANMFSGCSQLTSLNVSNFDTTNVTAMNSMFSNCKSLTDLNVSNFDTKSVINIGGIFTNCSSLITLDLSNFNTSKVTNMSWMFYWCNNLVELDLTNFDTRNVTNMNLMFNGCEKLSRLNISNFNTSKVTNMASMFGSCSNLTELDLNNFDTSSVTNMSSMFVGCSQLTSLNVSKFDTSKVTDMSSMFNNCNKLPNLDVSNFNTSNVTNMKNLFFNCSSLTSLNVSSFDTSKVTTMQSMFTSCRNLGELDLTNFDTSKVTDMQGMFSSTNNITKLDISSFDTSNVTDMSNMFSWNRQYLKNLDLSNFDTRNVTNMQKMFYGWKSLENLNFKKATFDKVTNYTDMFTDASSNIKIVTKNETTKTWLEDKLSGKGTVTITQ